MAQHRTISKALRLKPALWAKIEKAINRENTTFSEWATKQFEKGVK